MLHIHNSMTKKKELFTPIEAGKVKLYVCGMTVYDLCHIGHARVMVVFDMVTHYLRANGYKVTYIRNITDIDDKIIARAHKNGENIKELTERFIAEMHHDADALGVLRPDKEPQVTESMVEIIRMIETLIDRGYAYPSKNGDIYYDVSAFKSYGKLSGRNIDELRADEFTTLDEAKDDPLDFVLWKAAKPEEPAWNSPLIRGRPGWHIECSAMSAKSLGQRFDIHGGGQDLQFPHHENEIAQSEGAHGCQPVNYWMHNGFVRINNEKMSKSLGNYFTVREILRTYDPEIVRYFILNSRYRSPLNYSNQQLDQAKNALTRYYTALRNIEITSDVNWQNDIYFGTRFKMAMDDDFNTALALSVMAEIRLEINKAQIDKIKSRTIYLASLLRSAGKVLGLFQQSPTDFIIGNIINNNEKNKIKTLIDTRNIARKKEDWVKADKIRDALIEIGVILEDTNKQTTWRRV